MLKIYCLPFLLLVSMLSAVAQPLPNHVDIVSTQGICKITFTGAAVSTSCVDPVGTWQTNAVSNGVSLFDFDDIVCIVNVNAGTAVSAVGGVLPGTANYQCSIAGVLSAGTMALDATITNPVLPLWDANYIGVYHLSQTAALDSGVYANNGSIGKLVGTGNAAEVDLGAGAGFNITGPITISAWINPSALPGVNSYETISEKRYDGTNEQWAFMLQNDPTTGGVPSLLFATYNGVSHGVQWPYGAKIPAGAWSHVAGVFDGSTWRLYVNGVQVAAKADTQGPIASSGTPLIGASLINTTISRFFKGSIGEVKISNVARAAAAIAADFALGVPATFITLGQ
jgi:hypothetical protein